MNQENLDFTEIFRKANADKLIGINDWGIYNLEKSPDTEPNPKKIENEGMLMSLELFKDLLYHVALAQKKVKSRILITSFYGGGKSSLLRFIHKVTASQSRLKGLLLSGDDALDSIDTTIQYLCIDDVDIKKTMDFIANNPQIPCIIMSINSMNVQGKEFIIKSFLIPEENESTSKKFIFMENWESKDLINLTNARIASLSLSDDPLKLTSLFSQSMLDHLCKMVNNNPKAFLQLIAIIMRDTSSIQKDGIKIIPEEYIEDILDREGIKTFDSIREKKFTLTSKKVEILNKIDIDHINPSKITDETEKTKSNTSQHLRWLRDFNLINFDAKGKQRLYYRTLGGTLISEYLEFNEIKEMFS